MAEFIDAFCNCLLPLFSAQDIEIITREEVSSVTEKIKILKKSSVLIRVLAMLLPIVCIVLLLSLTAFAKNTYLINDGGRLLIHATYASDPAEVLAEAGLDLDEDDTYTTQTALGLSEITVTRNASILLVQDGNTTEIPSYGETVGDLIRRIGIDLSAEDILNYPLHTETFDGMEIIISHCSTTEQTYTADIPYEVIYCQDPTLLEGEEVVLTPGVKGQMLCVDTVSYVDGKEVSRTGISRDVLIQPVNAVIAVGNGVLQPGQGVFTTSDGEQVQYIRKLSVKATAYSRFDKGCNDWTATGAYATYGVIAVDPSIIPLGSKVYIVSDDGKFVYGFASAEDTGGAIKGNKIDLCYDSVAECFIFGRRQCTVYILSYGD